MVVPRVKDSRDDAADDDPFSDAPSSGTAARALLGAVVPVGSSVPVCRAGAALAVAGKQTILTGHAGLLCGCSISTYHRCVLIKRPDAVAVFRHSHVEWLVECAKECAPVSQLAWAWISE